MNWVPPPVDVRRIRRLLAILAVGACVLMLFVHGEQHVVRVAGGLSGGLVATFLYGPIQHIRMSPRLAPTVGAIAALLSLVPFIMVSGYSETAAPSEVVVSFVAGCVLYGGMLVADRMRSIWRESR